MNRPLNPGGARMMRSIISGHDTRVFTSKIISSKNLIFPIDKVIIDIHNKNRLQIFYKLFMAQQSVPNYPNNPNIIFKLLEALGKPFLYLLIFIGETTTNLILLPLKILRFILRKLKTFKIPNLKNPLSKINNSLTSSIHILTSFRTTLPHVTSIRTELRLSRILFHAIFWPCYYLGRLTYEILKLPFVIIKSSFHHLSLRSNFKLPSFTIKFAQLPSISIPKLKYQKISKDIINRFTLLLKRVTLSMIYKLLQLISNIIKKTFRYVKIFFSILLKIPASIFHWIMHFFSTIGDSVIKTIKSPLLIFNFFTDYKFRKKQKKLIKKKAFFAKASIFLAYQNAVYSIVHSVKSSKKKFKNNIRSVIFFITKNPDPVLRPFLFFLRTPRRALASSLLVISVFASFYFYVLKDLPSPRDLVQQKKAVSSRIFDRNGKLLFTIYNGNENRTMIRLSELPPYVAQASIAIEDKDFYRHHGLSIKGVIRAAERNFLHSNVVEGGSTITQQLVKNALLTPERTVKRKIKELMLAFGTEMIYSKNEILEMYLNEVPYGGPTYGIQEAARLFFGKQAKDLSLAEAALLAGLPAAPTTYSPHGLNKDYAKARQLQVLNNMVSEGYISAEEADKTSKEELAYSPNLISIRSPHFVMWVRDLLNQKYGRKVVEEGGLDIYTTLDLDLQEKAEEIVKRNVEQLEKPYWISNADALVTDPRNGEVLAMVGSRDFFDVTHDGNVNVTIQPRQPGSSIKLITYSYALGHGMTPSTIINDSPVTYRNAWESYSPVNYDGKYRGNVKLKDALAMSLNIPAVKTTATFGADKIVEQGIKMGIKSWKNLKNYGLSITLGAGDVQMTEMAVAYGSIANYGKKVELNPIKKITNYQGMVLEDVDIGLTKNSLITEAYAKNEEPPSSDPVVSPFVAYELIDILSDNKARLPTFGPYAKLEIPGHRVAVKTGTTDNKKDNWTIGFTPSRLVATWVGNNDNKPMNPHLASGITGAAPIWNEIMSEILKDKPDEEFPRPEGMVEIEVCEVNGLLPCDRCPKVVKQFFVPGQEPTKKCYFPSTTDCNAKKAQMEKEGKKSEEIVKALAGCPLSAPSPKP